MAQITQYWRQILLLILVVIAVSYQGLIIHSIDANANFTKIITADPFSMFDTTTPQIRAFKHQNALQVAVPFEIQPSVANERLTVSLLDAADKVIAQATSEQTSKGWHAKLPLSQAIAPEDLIWYRVRCQMSNGTKMLPSKIYPLNEALTYPVMQVLGQRQLAASGQNALRVVVLDKNTGNPIETGALRVQLQTADSAAKILATNTLKIDEHGTVNLPITAPANYQGKATIKIVADTPIGEQQLTEIVDFVPRESVLLTTDKPIYQPGHLIHLRSLALDRFSRQAIANQPLIFEIEDAKGNKVFKQRTTTDEFGVAFTQFQLADEVNMGNFKLRAILGNPDNPQATRQEKTFLVDRYVLPKFKLAINLQGGEDERQQKRYYRPGEMVTGRITAKYLFGKPINGQVKVSMASFDVEKIALGQVAAQLDDQGQYNFSMRLPDFLAGRSFEQGAAPVALQVEVTDSANHTESRAESLLVSNNPILITAVPEAGDLVPRLKNRVYLLTTYPDGTPVATSIKGNIEPAVLKTDENGIATIEVSNRTDLQLTATDNTGQQGNANIALAQRQPGEDSLLMRPNRALYKVGDSLALNLFATKKVGSVYLDIIKDRQTISTRALDLKAGQAKVTIDLTADMFGALEVRAYIFGRDAEPISDRRIIFVDPADDLQIAAMPVKESFRPGEEATVNIEVRDQFGKPRSAVVDVQVVDEAVFALSEKRPGLEKVFFLLEQELLKPRYEIHGISSPDDLVAPPEGPNPVAENRRESAARILLAAATEVAPYTLRVVQKDDDIRQAKVNQYYSQYNLLTRKYGKNLIEKMNRYYQAIAKANSTTNINDDIAAALQAGYLTEEEIRDPWGNRFNLQQTNSESRRASEQITYFSQPIKPNFLPYAFYLNFYGYTTSVLATTTATPTPDTQPFKGNVSITEEAVSTGNYGRVGGKITQKAQNRNAAVRNATIKLRNRQTNQISTALTDAGGSFQFPAVAAGSYDILIEAPGQAPTSYTPINLAARAEAYVEALLSNTTAVTPGKKLFQLSLNYPQLNKRQLRGVETELDVAGIQDGIVDGVIVGGVAGGVVGGVDARPLPEAPAAARPLARGNAANSVMAAPLQKTTSADKAKSEAKKDAAPAESATSSGGVDEGPRIRSYFPETLYVNPVVITDKQGRATLRIPLADSITTWRMTMLASTKKGALGSNTAGLRVFQDFFIDLDMPVALTQGDSVTIPVAVYNYLDSNQDVELTLKQEDWFVMENDTPVKQTFINASEVGAINYRIRANRLGKNTLTVTARLLNRNSVANGDGIAREIEVLPNGERQELVINDRLENTATKQVDIPANAIDDASKILVKFFPGPLSQVVDGLDGILQMPGGCFEQTSSSTYPNILVMDYMKTTKKITPEIQVKAEGFISQGYQRLVTFEVPGGGFSWFGQAPAHKILTSYGLLEFTDMSRVHEVDPRVIERTQRWLASKQKADGSWEIDKDGIAEGAINNFQRDQVRVASYIAWALAYSGYKGPEVARAKTYVEKNLTGQEDAYTLAITANFAQDYKQDPNWTQRVMDFLAAKAIREGDLTHWAAPEQTPTHGRGATAEVETTALAIQAIIKSNSNLQMATQAINYLNSKKDARGTWGSTQPTIQALKALLLSQKKGGSGDVVGNVMVSINGRQAKQIKLNRDNNDLLHQVDLKEFTVKGNNRVQLQFQGQGTMLYQIVGRHFRSWEQASGKGLRPEAAEPLDINVQYDRTQLAQDEIVTSKVIVRNRLNKTVNMVMVDLGVPPGFEVLAEDIQKLVNTDPQSKVGNVTKFSITARQVIIYLDGLRPNQTLQLQYRLRAKYPLRAQAPVSRVYEYYNPAVNAVSTPKELVVVARKK